MNLQFQTARRLHEFLTSRGIPYAIIGGLAVQRWGQPRLTRDVDVTMLLPPGGEEAALREIVATFPPRIEDAVAFALKHCVLPIAVPEGSEADLSLGLPGGTLDVAYVRRWLAELGQLAEDPEVAARFERAWARYGRPN